MTNYPNPEALKDPGNFIGRRVHVLDLSVEMMESLRSPKKAEARLPKHPLLDIDSYLAPGSRNAAPVYGVETPGIDDSSIRNSLETPDELVQKAIRQNIEAIHEAKTTEERVS